MQGTATTIFPPTLVRGEWLCAAFGFEAQQIEQHQDGSVRYAMLAYGSDTIILLPADDATRVSGPGADSGPALQSCYCIIDNADAQSSAIMSSSAPGIRAKTPKDTFGTSGRAIPDA